ncbi:MAG: hypothetical protein LBC68_08660 [Prevotellaceae bacterium]|jgi:hypothetical protein|nr:hypothetical protein [Prevotellaceae bacterium]
MSNKIFNPTWIISIILTIITPFVVLNVSYFKNLTPLDRFGYVLSLILIIASTFILLYNILELKIKAITKSNAAIKNQITHLTEAISSIDNYVYAVDKTKLYSKMSDFLENSTLRIDLMYLGKNPPLEYKIFPEKQQYINTLSNKILLSNVQIRRVVLFTRKNKEYIKEFADTHKNQNNFSLYILDDDKLDAISVQIFDSSKVVLMNLDNSDMSIDKRDVVVESEQLNSIFEFYYARILKDSNAIKPIIENGKVNADNYSNYLCC